MDTWRRYDRRGPLHTSHVAAWDKVSTWASVLAEIMNDWHSPKGKDLGEVLAGHTPYDWVIKSFFSASRS